MRKGSTFFLPLLFMVALHFSFAGQSKAENSASNNTGIADINFVPSARFRYQQVDDTIRGNAIANTVKLRLSADWQANENFMFFAQADYVHGFNEEKYNSVAVSRATSPIPETLGGELNQAWVKYSNDSDWSATIGRQILGFDNERHISSIEFWQNDQTFDALKIVYNDSLYWDVSYAYISKVNRIFGDDAKAILPPEDIRFVQNRHRPFLELGNHDHNSHLFNFNYKFNRFLNLTAYAYLLDNKTANQLSSDTLGMRLKGEAKPGIIKYGYTAEMAHQRTASNSAWDFTGYYVFAELSAQYKSHQIALSHERLGEDKGFAFATSLGNNHLFLGWADIFSSYLNTDGIRDTFVTYRGRDAKLRWRVVVHQYNSDSTGVTAGHELDIEVAYRFDRKWESTFLHSRYVAKDGIQGILASQNDLSTWTISLSYNF
jgi:hypothetical protein